VPWFQTQGTSQGQPGVFNSCKVNGMVEQKLDGWKTPLILWDFGNFLKGKKNLEL